MKRAIVDYKKLTKEILSLLVEKYPEGYQDSDVIRFKNAKGETVEALEVRTDDTTYLVKVSTRLANTMERYDEDDYYGEGTLEMSREDEIALRHKKDATKGSSPLQMDLEDDEDDEDERDEYGDESSEDDYDDEEEDDEDEENVAIANER